MSQSALRFPTPSPSWAVCGGFQHLRGSYWMARSLPCIFPRTNVKASPASTLCNLHPVLALSPYVSWADWRETPPGGGRMMWGHCGEMKSGSNTALWKICMKKVCCVYFCMLLWSWMQGELYELTLRCQVINERKFSLSTHLIPYSLLHDIEVKIIALESRLQGFKSWFLCYWQCGLGQVISCPWAWVSSSGK